MHILKLLTCKEVLPQLETLGCRGCEIVKLYRAPCHDACITRLHWKTLPNHTLSVQASDDLSINLLNAFGVETGELEYMKNLIQGHSWEYLQCTVTGPFPVIDSIELPLPLVRYILKGLTCEEMRVGLTCEELLDKDVGILYAVARESKLSHLVLNCSVTSHQLSRLEEICKVTAYYIN